MPNSHYSTSSSTTIRAAGQVVGQVVDGKFVKRVKRSRHMLKAPKGWAFDTESLAHAESLGAGIVEIHDTESGTVYSAPIVKVLTKGFCFDRGFGPQVCLPLQSWTVHRPGEARQLSLSLGGVV